jgi:hypothetical protein
MKITQRHLRQIIRKELSLLSEASILSVFDKPKVNSTGTQIIIQKLDGSIPVPSQKLGVRVVKEGPFGVQLSHIFDVSALSIDSWTPDVPEGQPFMTVSFTVAGNRKTGIKLKNKVALKKIADAILAGTKAEGEFIPFENFSAAIIVNYDQNK